MRNIIIIMLLLIAGIASAQKSLNLNDNDVFSKEDPLKPSIGTLIKTYSTKSNRSRPFTINKLLQDAKTIENGDTIVFELFENKNYKAVVQDIITDINKTVTITANIPQFPMSMTFINTNEAKMSHIVVSIPELNETYRTFSNITTNESYLSEIDKSREIIPNMENDIIKIPKEPIIKEINKNESVSKVLTRSASCASPTLGPDDPAVIDILIVYTPAAAAWSAKNQGGINNTIASMMALSNLTMKNSLTGITFRLAHSEQVNYTEDGKLLNSISRLQNNNDGYMDNVHALRTKYKADLVQLLTIDEDNGGLGYQINNVAGQYELGFSACMVSLVGGEHTASVHEIGHNFGLGHGAEQLGENNGIFPYSFGWRWKGSDINIHKTYYYCSVMSYWSGDNYADGISAMNVPYFSNPNVTYQNNPTGDTKKADAARSLREMKHVIASYSDIIILRPDTPTNIQTSKPTEHGSTFRWDAVDNAVEYQLYTVVDGVAYYWTTSSTSIVINYEPLYKPCKSYVFWIKTINECNLSSESEQLTFNTSCSGTNNEAFNKISIFPNPVKDILYIKNIDYTNTPIAIYDISGRLIKTEKLNDNTSVNVSNLSPGMYFLIIGNKSFEFIKK